MSDGGYGVVGDIVIGLVGALIGGWIVNNLETASSFWSPSCTSCAASHSPPEGY